MGFWGITWAAADCVIPVHSCTSGSSTPPVAQHAVSSWRPPRDYKLLAQYWSQENGAWDHFCNQPAEACYFPLAFSWKSQTKIQKFPTSSELLTSLTSSEGILLYCYRLADAFVVSSRMVVNFKLHFTLENTHELMFNIKQIHQICCPNLSGLLWYLKTLKIHILTGGSWKPHYPPCSSREQFTLGLSSFSNLSASVRLTGSVSKLIPAALEWVLERLLWNRQGWQKPCWHSCSLRQALCCRRCCLHGLTRNSNTCPHRSQSFRSAGHTTLLA